MLSSIEKEGGAEEAQEMIFFRKGGIEWRRPEFEFLSARFRHQLKIALLFLKLLMPFTFSDNN